MATRKIVPRADNEGGIGTALKQWASGWIKALTVTTINALTLAAASVGFTIAGGTTSKTLTVDETVAMSDKAPKANPAFTGTVKMGATGGSNLLDGGVVPVNNSSPVTVYALPVPGTGAAVSGMVLINGVDASGDADCTYMAIVYWCKSGTLLVTAIEEKVGAANGITSISGDNIQFIATGAYLNYIRCLSLWSSE